MILTEIEFYFFFSFPLSRPSYIPSFTLKLITLIIIFTYMYACLYVCMCMHKFLIQAAESVVLHVNGFKSDHSIQQP